MRAFDFGNLKPYKNKYPNIAIFVVGFIDKNENEN
jgi:hypothetical protein